MVNLADIDALPVGRTSSRVAPAVRRLADADISVVSDRIAFDALEEDWRSLDDASTGSTLFQSFPWCRAIYDHHQRHAQDFEPRVVVLRDKGHVLGLFPLQMVRSGLTRVLTGFGEPFQQYSDVLLSPDAPDDAAARLLQGGIL